jgi:hypothetical protein
MGLAPPFTRENAAEMARRATASRERNRAERKKALLLACDPQNAQTRAKLQVDKVLAWMENCRDRETYSELVTMLDRLWDKAFPRQGTAKPTRRSPGNAQPEPLPADPSTQ